MSPQILSEEELTPQGEFSKKERPSRFRWGWLIVTLVLISGAGYLTFRFWPQIRGLWMPAQRSALVGEPILSEPWLTFDIQDPAFFQEWKEHVFEKNTAYTIEAGEDQEQAIHALSRGTSSAYFKEVNLSLSDKPVLSWEWKAVQFPSKKKNKTLASKSDNDFAARVYAVFKGHTPILSDVIQYVWDDHFPEGAFTESPYSGKVRIIVVQSGKLRTAGEWVSEKRDVAKDYELLFGKKAHGTLLAIGVMSDADNTGTVAEAYYRRLAIEKRKES